MGTAVQTSIADLGTPLQDVTFVVVDLETTGGAPADAGITEIGAVKVRGGELIGQFQSLVNPGAPIPPFVASLTGITDALVAGAPRLAAILPAFLEFLGDAVLVAHNAPYDVGFLTAACRLHDYPWPGPVVVDTARLARVALHREEVRNCKLGTLAAHFRATVTPNHRAFDDASATADVLHALIGRAGDLGVTTLEDLTAFASRVSHAQRTKRHLADGLPDAPGVYVFQDAEGEALYVGTSRSIRTRVRSYFTASEQRRRMAEMVRIAQRVVPIVCATTLEARVRELRLIAQHKPRYNRRSRRPESETWLKLTVEAAPRLSVVRSVVDDHAEGARYLGPFTSRRSAEAAAEVLLLAHPVRTCTTRIAQRPRSQTPGCALAELGRCLAPCTADGDRAAYAVDVDALREAMSGDLSAAVAAAQQRMGRLADEERFEEAAIWRERLGHLTTASVRTHRIAALAADPQIVAAQPTAHRGWDIHLIRHGRLAGAAHAPAGVDPRPVVDALVAAGEHVTPAPIPAPAALTEETRELIRWLDTDGVRLVRSTYGLALPTACGGEVAAMLGEVRRAGDTGPVRAARSMHRQRLDDQDYGQIAGAGRPQGPVDARPVTRILSA
jgi:DNA polymerase III subunit epsilon